MAEAPYSEKELLTSTFMYLDQVRSEMRLKYNTIYWELDYKEIGPKDEVIRYDPSLGYMSFTKTREKVNIILTAFHSCKAQTQVFVVYHLENENRRISEPIFAKKLEDKIYTFTIPITLIDTEKNKHLKKSGRIILGITYNVRRLMNTKIGIYIEKENKPGNFLEAYQKRLFTDFIIRAGGEEFHVHKAIMSARSIHFFRNSTIKEVALDDKVTVKTVQNLIHYLYTGELQTVALDEMIEIFDLSIALYIPSLIDQCIIYFLDTMDEKILDRVKKFYSKKWEELSR